MLRSTNFFYNIQYFSTSVSTFQKIRSQHLRIYDSIFFIQSSSSSGVTTRGVAAKLVGSRRELTHGRNGAHWISRRSSDVRAMAHKRSREAARGDPGAGEVSERWEASPREGGGGMALAGAVVSRRKEKNLRLKKSNS
jgi:hypothetical protein